MAIVQQISDTEFIISVTDASVKGAYRTEIEDPLPPVGEAATKSFTATITLKITDDFAAYARTVCASKLTLDIESVSQESISAVLDGVISSPIPVAPIYGDSGVPELTKEDIGNMSYNLESVNTTKEITFTANISNNARYTIMFMPDAKGFDIKLIDMSAGVSMYEEHPFVLVTPFIIGNLAPSFLQDGPGVAEVPGSMNDARIFVLEKEETVQFAETLTNEIIKMRGVVSRGDISDAYPKLIAEMFWRDGSIPAEDAPSSPHTTHIYGVGVSGKALQVIELTGLKQNQMRPGIISMFRGTATTRYIYGDIRYPGNPRISAAKPRFDIITDSEEWTLYGPLSPKYVGSETAGDEPTAIFSWEGRASASPKKIPQIAAQLENFN